MTDGREIGALITSNLLAGVSGRTAIVRISSGMMEGCVVPAVLPRTGVQTTSSLHLGTVSGRVTLVLGFAVLLQRMIGSLVLAVVPEPGVLTTSSPRLGTVNGGEGVVEAVVLLLKMIGSLVQDVLPKLGVLTTFNLDLVTVPGVVVIAKRLTSVPVVAPVAGVRMEGRLSVPGTVVVVNVPWLSRIGVRTMVGGIVKLLALVVGVVATDVLITAAEMLVAVERVGRRVTMRRLGQTPVVGAIVTRSVFPTIMTLKQSLKKKKYPLTTLIQTQPTMLMKRSR